MLRYVAFDWPKVICQRDPPFGARMAHLKSHSDGLGTFGFFRGAISSERNGFLACLLSRHRHLTGLPYRVCLPNGSFWSKWKARWQKIHQGEPRSRNLGEAGREGTRSGEDVLGHSLPWADRRCFFSSSPSKVNPTEWGQISGFSPGTKHLIP